MTKEIAKQQEEFFSIDDVGSFIVQSGESFHTGMEDLSAADIKMPKYKLMQLTSKEVGDSRGKILPGTFLNTITGESVEKLEAVILSVGKTRVRWPKPFKRGQAALCRSFDAETGETADGHRLTCATCPYGQWGKGGDKDNRPDCNLSYTLIGQTDFADQASIPFRIIISGASVSKAKDFFTALMMSAKKLPIYAYRIVLSSEHESNDQGSYYTVKFDFKKMKDANGVEKVVGVNPVLVPELKRTSEALKNLFNDEIVRTDIEEAPEMAAPPSQNTGLF